MSTELIGRDAEELQYGALGVGDGVPEGLDETIAIAEAMAALMGEQGEELAGGGSPAGTTFGYVLQGSVTKRWMTCGRASCGCLEDPDSRHGPYHSWTYKRAGKTISVYLSPAQARLCSERINNNRRLERLVAKLRRISRRIAQLEQIPTK